MHGAITICRIYIFCDRGSESRKPHSIWSGRYRRKGHDVSFYNSCLAANMMRESLRLRLTKSTLASLLLCFSAVTLSAKPPPEMMQVVDNLAMTGASLNNCFKSTEYKNLSTKQSMRIHDSSSEIESIVTKIQNYYRTSNLLPAYHITVVQYMESHSIKQQTIQRYKSLCSNAFIDAVEAYVNQSNQKINAFLSSGRR